MVAVLENTNGGNYTGTTVPTGFTGVMATGSTNIAAILNKGSGAVFVMTN